ncbi:hypothetical protein BRAS3843_3110034 [Bradyrhizobium sp. STM 3843]|nr:hypothetical protein BRAS3843_3110034 [Bradyrhizobium sp. STM 3843]
MTKSASRGHHPRELGGLTPNAGGNEVPIEAWYGWQATGWMNLKFDAQYVINPGGRGFNAAGVKTGNAWVFGLRTVVHF